jgi:hypothetical protein
MAMNIKFLIIITIIFFLKSCGFRPIYYNSNLENKNISYHEKLTLIKIKKYRSNIDYELYDDLVKILNPYNIKSDKKYILDIKLTNRISSTYTTSTGSSGRNKVILNAKYKLLDIASGELVGFGNSSQSGDYDVGDKRFANYITEEDTKSHLVKLIAKDIRNMIINDLYQ